MEEVITFSGLFDSNGGGKHFKGYFLASVAEVKNFYKEYFGGHF